MPSILVVCTGNICRSPMAEGFLRNLLARRRAGHIDVTSVGTSGWDGSPATAESVEAAMERGADISGHRARRLDPSHVLSADLVVGMTTQHRDRAVQMVPEAHGRSFTMKELVRLLEALPAGEGVDLEGRVAAAAALRDDGFAGNPHDEDVSDPIGMSLAVYRAVAWEVDGLSQRLVGGLLGREPEASSMAGMWHEGE
jgi:protein-tyrosine-phosphatase